MEADLAHVYSDHVYPYAPEVDRYVVRMIKRLDATSVADMRRVMDAFHEDGCKVPDWRLKSRAEEYLRGTWMPAPEIGAEAIAAFLALYGRPALIAEAGESGDDDGTDQEGSRFFGLPCLEEGLAWPKDGEGEPMRFVAQFNVGRAGFVIEQLPEAEILQVFISRDEDCPEDMQVLTSDKGRPRAMAVLPEGYEAEPAKPAALRTVTSYPDRDEPLLAMPEGLNVDNFDESDLGRKLAELRDGNTWPTQVGGWPQYVQGPPHAEIGEGLYGTGRTTFLIQVSDDIGLEFGDSGLLYAWLEEHPPGSGEQALRTELQIC